MKFFTVLEKTDDLNEVPRIVLRIADNARRELISKGLTAAGEQRWTCLLLRDQSDPFQFHYTVGYKVEVREVAA